MQKNRCKYFDKHDLEVRQSEVKANSKYKALTHIGVMLSKMQIFLISKIHYTEGKLE